MTKVKICGITELDDARRAASLGAWALGMIFWPGSPRRCEPEAAEEIGAALRRQAELAGVFVNATLDQVADAADRFHLSLLQLHGDEGPAYCREAARRTGCRVIKAATVRNAASIRALEPFHTDYHLLDAHVPDVPGGTGRTFEWELARTHGGAPLLLSGGLTPSNVAEAIAIAEPFAVDVASGTEAAPGRKDGRKLEEFFRAVGAAAAERAPA